MMRKALITGSAGLVGSEATRHLLDMGGWKVYGLDNDMRGKMFGTEGSTATEQQKLIQQYPDTFIPITADIRDPMALKEVFKLYGDFDYIVHTAAQPAHEWSTNNALSDFQINAYGTLSLLENYRLYSPEAVFIHVSSSKVYGDEVNNLPLKELETRYDLPKTHKFYSGTDETMRLDGNLHSLFGASKACADIVAKEYATYFKLPISIFRPVCITGSAHKGVSIHGYLSYLVKCVATGTEYKINGYKGKQVRDNIHARDLVRAFYEVYKNPKQGVYNIGGGRESNNSILEALVQAGDILGKKPVYTILDNARRGDHLWCIFSSEKFKKEYPDWKLEYNNDLLMKEICSLYQ